MPKSEIQFSVDRPEQSVGFVFWKATLFWQKKMSEALKPLSLTHVQFVLLAGIAWLQHNNEEVTQMMLAHHAEVDVMMTSKVIRALSNKKLVIRHEHSTDTRAKSLKLTDSGKALLKRALVIVEKVDAEFFKPLKKDKNQFSNNLRLLMKKNLNVGENDVDI